METVLSSEVMQDFDSLVSQHRPRIFRFLLASLRDRESAENLTQECFVRAYRARDQFRGAASISTWLLQIAANLVRDHESSGRLKFWRRALGIDLRDVMDSVPDRQLSPESMLSVKQEVAAIWRVAAKLSERQRTVLLLRFVEDLDLLEIAEVTGLKLGTVKTHLFRALEAVRTALEERK
ncbi:MAG: RNA polymerase sigma factor [Bryobacteraceae bacterium]|jgi:RNA polymerase sigma-70 factor, ECF subfamily